MPAPSPVFRPLWGRGKTPQKTLLPSSVDRAAGFEPVGRGFESLGGNLLAVVVLVVAHILGTDGAQVRFLPMALMGMWC